MHEGTRQLAQTFQQAKATHAMQLRTILMKLMLKGVLAPESVGYISSLAPQTPMLPVGATAAAAPYPTCRGPGGGGGAVPPQAGYNGTAAPSATGWMDGGGVASGGRCPSIEGLQAQLDALEAGLAPLSNLEASLTPLGCLATPMLGSQDNTELHGDDALQLFGYCNGHLGSRSQDSAHGSAHGSAYGSEQRLPPYPVDAHVQMATQRDFSMGQALMPQH